MEQFLKLCLITNQQNQSLPDFLNFIERAVQAGVTLVQLRDKIRKKQELEKIALELKKILNHAKIPLIINDHVDLAKEIEADGVHLGQEDLNAEEAIKILGENKIIGVSIEHLQDLDETNKLKGRVYITASAVFKSQSKNNCKTIWGIEGLKKIVAKSIHPVTAIGNINKKNIDEVIKAGAKGVAVMSAINLDNPEFSVKELLKSSR